MRFAFLCSSLADGCDGVGDYARLLASACEEDGHECLLVGLHDRHLLGHDVRNDNGDLRFPQGLPWRSKAARLRDALNLFRPDCVSWQLVPYGFDSRGILPSHMALLAEAAADWSQHLMLHELWVGISRNAGPSERIIGSLQRFRLLDFLDRLRPSRVHTSNEAYQQVLMRIGITSALLPLFGNIPVVPMDRVDAEMELRLLAGDKLPDGPHAVGILFGTLHPQWAPEETLAWIRDASRISGRRIVIVAVGRSGQHGKTLLARLGGDGSLSVTSLGELPANWLSAVFQAADFAIATHPWALIGKSGTTATLLEHGLPVLVPRDDWHLRGGPTPGPNNPLLSLMRDTSPREFRSFLGRRRSPAPRLAEVAAQFVSELAGHAVNA
jgi:hypothetical protein